MLEYFSGSLEEINQDSIVIECNSIGYLIYISKQTNSNLPTLKSKMKIYLHQHIRDDEHTLYGFLDKRERILFRQLLNISGIGPKVSLGILSFYSVDNVISSIIKEDTKSLSSVPGIGKKTANRIILELKDKFKDIIISDQVIENKQDSINSKAKIEAIEALSALGFSYSQSTKLVSDIYKEGMTLENIISTALSGADTQ